MSGRARSAATAPAGSRRWSANHVVDLVNKYPREQLPESLTGYVRGPEGYDYLHHAEVGSSNAAFVGDEVVDRFCVLGPAEEHIAKLRELAAAGVDQFNIYLMNGDEEAQLEAYGRDIIPALRERTGKPMTADDLAETIAAQVAAAEAEWLAWLAGRPDANTLDEPARAGR